MRGALFAAAVGAVALTAFAVMRQVAPSYTAQADGELPTPDFTPPAGDTDIRIEPIGGVGEDNPPGPDVTPEPGITPDTSKSWWYVPYLNQEENQPRHDQVIAGITIGPKVERKLTHSCSSPVEALKPEEAGESAVSLSLVRVPNNGVVAESYVSVCDGIALSASLHATMPPDPAIGFRGGWLSIYKAQALPQVSSSIPSERWTEGKVGSRPAAIASPLLEDGFGRSAVVVFADGVLLSIAASGLTTDEVVAIAEEQLK